MNMRNRSDLVGNSAEIGSGREGAALKALGLAGILAAGGCTPDITNITYQTVYQVGEATGATDDSGSGVAWEAPESSTNPGDFTIDVFNQEVPNTYYLLCDDDQVAAYNSAVYDGWGSYEVGELNTGGGTVACDGFVAVNGETGAVAEYAPITISPAGDSTASEMSETTFSPFKVRFDEPEEEFEGRDLDGMENLFFRPDATTNIMGRVVVARLAEAVGFPIKKAAFAWVYTSPWLGGAEPENAEQDFDHDWRQENADLYGGKPSAVIKGVGDLLRGEGTFEVATGDEEAALSRMEEIRTALDAFDPEADVSFLDYAQDNGLIDFQNTTGGLFPSIFYSAALNLCDSSVTGSNNIIYVIEPNGALGNSFHSTDYSGGFCGNPESFASYFSDWAYSRQTQLCIQDEACFNALIDYSKRELLHFLSVDPVAVEEEVYAKLQENGMERGIDASAHASNQAFFEGLTTVALPILQAYGRCYTEHVGTQAWIAADGTVGAVTCPYAAYGTGEGLDTGLLPAG